MQIAFLMMYLKQTSGPGLLANHDPIDNATFW
jgi:hypothetical protein